MKMKAKFLFIYLIGAVFGLTSCNDYLNMTPTNEVSDKLIWSNESYATMAVNYFYGDIPYLGSFSTGQCLAGMTEGLTDEFKYGSTTYNSYMYIPNEISYGGSVLTASYVEVYMGNWSTLYKEVRLVNEALFNLAKYGSFDAATTTKFKAELRFFRGMYYSDLVKRYKQVILYNEDLTKINTDQALSTESAGWDFVEADLKYAAENLTSSAAANGRITSGVAYAMLSRAMLYAKRWSDAQAAAKSVIGSGLYSLTTNYAKAFTDNNSEAILQYTYDAGNSVTHDFDSYYAPAGDKTYDGMSTDGGFGTPTQDMVESYELATGGYPDWSKWHTASGTTETPPYDQLEPRFAASILYNGSTWKDRTIQPYVGGTDGWAVWLTNATPEGKTTTGYYLRKLVDETHHFSVRQASTQPWIAIRLAEVYLNYAEACYNVGGADNFALARKYVDLVRSRVGLPSIGTLSGDDLMAAIRHERKIELAYEGLYYWDMRRWGLSVNAFTDIRRHGLKIEKNDNGSFTYTYVEVDRQNLNFPSKMYSCPLPQAELDNNKLVSQFTEWK